MPVPNTSQGGFGSAADQMRRVRVMLYGPSVGENTRATTYGHFGRLQQGDVAISPNLLRSHPMGSNITVNGRTYRVADTSWFSEGNPTSNTVEIWNGDPKTPDYGNISGGDNRQSAESFDLPSDSSPPDANSMLPDALASDYPRVQVINDRTERDFARWNGEYMVETGTDIFPGQTREDTYSYNPSESYFTIPHQAMDFTDSQSTTSYEPFSGGEPPPSYVNPNSQEPFNGEVPPSFVNPIFQTPFDGMDYNDPTPNRPHEAMDFNDQPPDSFGQYDGPPRDPRYADPMYDWNDGSNWYNNPIPEPLGPIPPGQMYRDGQLVDASAAVNPFNEWWRQDPTVSDAFAGANAGGSADPGYVPSGVMQDYMDRYGNQEYDNGFPWSDPVPWDGPGYTDYRTPVDFGDAGPYDYAEGYSPPVDFQGAGTDEGSGNNAFEGAEAGGSTGDPFSGAEAGGSFDDYRPQEVYDDEEYVPPEGTTIIPIRPGDQPQPQPSLNQFLQQFPNLNNPASIRARQNGADPSQLIGRNQFDSHAENLSLMASQAFGGSPNNTGNTGDAGHTLYNHVTGQRTWRYDPKSRSMVQDGPIWNPMNHALVAGSNAAHNLTPEQSAYARSLLASNFQAQFASGNQSITPVSNPPPNLHGNVASGGT